MKILQGLRVLLLSVGVCLAAPVIANDQMVNISKDPEVNAELTKKLFIDVLEKHKVLIEGLAAKHGDSKQSLEGSSPVSLTPDALSSFAIKCYQLKAMSKNTGMDVQAGLALIKSEYESYKTHVEMSLSGFRAFSEARGVMNPVVASFQADLYRHERLKTIKFGALVEVACSPH
jgi:hypothetical protein